MQITTTRDSVQHTSAEYMTLGFSPFNLKLTFG